MTSTDAPIDLDLALLMADARVFRGLVVDQDPQRALVLGPYVAMFVVESLDVLRRRQMATGTFGAHAKAIEQSRHALKFLDDSELGARGVLQNYARMGAASHQIFVASHKGWLGPLKRWLQDDLGLFVEDGRLIGTTDAVMVQQFSDREKPPKTLADLRALGPELKTRAYEIGRYIATLLSAFNLDPPPLSSPRPPPSRVDVKRHVFYGRLLRPSAKSDQALAMVLTALLSSTNFALHVLPVAAGREGPIESWFLFKWRLITLFHVGSSLRRVVAHEQAKEVLRPDVLTAIVELRRASKHVQKLKPIRDALVHYGFGKPSKPNHETPLQRLTTLVQADASLAESALAEISTVLTRLLPSVG